MYPRLQYLPGTFPAEYGGVLGEMDYLLQQVPGWMSRLGAFLYPLWMEWWWLVFILVPVRLIFKITMTVVKLRMRDGMVMSRKHKLPSPSPGDPKWRWVCWRFARRCKYWW